MFLSSPVFLLGSAVATAWAGLFHLLFGRRWRELILYWFMSLVGFAVGQGVAEAMGWEWLLLGQVHLLEGTLLAWLAMAVARAFQPRTSKA
ncbi:MAG: hypothetical protein H5T70_01860 [Chloroflexi bacterium]|nr:hypothetical protein [Chloroflexota bacterium]